jgi:hypothetical protein
MHRRPIFAAAMCLIAAGCGGNPHRLAPVSGKVTLDNKPLAGVLVSFMPETKPGSTAGVTSRGTTDAAGRYSLSTSDNRPGAIVGAHVVRISTRKLAEGSAEVAEGQSANQAVERLPARYNIRTELSFEVPEDGTETADFPLQSK